jgi:endonuclease YncB( thermonuclease family)
MAQRTNNNQRWLPRLRGFGWTLVLLALLAALWLVNRPPLHEGRMAFASDGDSFTLAIDGERRPVRLLGLDAPELHQICQDRRGGRYPCGARARDALAGLAPRGALLACRSEGQDRFDRALSRCTLADGRDLAATLVRGGWAVATTEDYLVEQDLARAAKLGLWQGEFLTPAEWRAANPRN